MWKKRLIEIIADSISNYAKSYSFLSTLNSRSTILFYFDKLIIAHINDQNINKIILTL